MNNKPRNPEKDQRPEDDRRKEPDRRQEGRGPEDEREIEEHGTVEGAPGPPPEGPDYEPAEENAPEPAERSEAGWNLMYVLLVALVVISLIIVVGIVNFGGAVNSTIYIITLALLAIAVIHWLGVW